MEYNKNLIKVISLAIGLVFVLAMLTINLHFIEPANAAAQTHSARFYIGKTTYQVDSKDLGMDAPPYIDSGRTLVPVRYLAQALGMTVQWDEATQTVSLDGDKTIKLVIANKTMTVDNKPVQMDVQPVITNGRTMLPARWIAEALGYVVGWDAANQAVTIDPPQPPGEIQSGPFKHLSKYITMKLGSTIATVVPVIPIQEETFTRKFMIQDEIYKQVKSEYGDFSNLPWDEKKARLNEMQKECSRRYQNNAEAKQLDIKLQEAEEKSKYIIDLGVAPIMVSTQESIDFWKSKSSNVYTEGTYIAEANSKSTTVYVPFLPIAKAFGMPESNIKWDGEKLTIYKKPSIYWVLTSGTDQVIFTDTGEVTGKKFTGPVTFECPLRVKNGVPMMDEGDIIGLLIPGAGEGITDGIQDCYEDFTIGISRLGCIDNLNKEEIFKQ